MATQRVAIQIEDESPNSVVYAERKTEEKLIHLCGQASLQQPLMLAFRNDLEHKSLPILSWNNQVDLLTAQLPPSPSWSSPMPRTASAIRSISWADIRRLE
ncbi:hypothetical protein FOL46_003990 [Perkinsus olseni]|uniref:Uncharacterized protein n=1 Tax=Perkinsus olseni TaxID=32597 RepID=A0A7J6M039_PEROL|nr:hypothetical protein FOL46_003990 [Perkinsus olseni]